MDLELTGKTAVVTGASKGIGLETARLLAREGATVHGIARTLPAPIAGVSFLPRDLTDETAAADLAEMIGPVDILVNNLGAVLPRSMDAAGFLALDVAAWRETFELNLFATVRVTQAFLPSLLSRRGVVVNVSSIGARAAYQPVDYGAAKAALTNMSKALSEEFGDKGLRSVTVTPGPTRTANWGDPSGYAGHLADQAGVSLDEFVRAVPEAMSIASGRLSEPEETAALIAFLASPRASNLTGADFIADGGTLKAV